MFSTSDHCISINVYVMFLNDMRSIVITVSSCASFLWSQDSSQIGLLKELLDLQKDMVVMLLSLLEGKIFFSVVWLSIPVFSPCLVLFKLLFKLYSVLFRKRGKWYNCPADGRHVG